ncbi:MAG TPA: DUF5667 domain-containing protein, partial [Herpetosiphonaceae bacterium]|nr:DUF5667 domain-containing protein [Herpetosiphonaceae bacterium]
MNDELLEQILARHAAGASVEALCAAHPDHAGQIRRVLLTVDRLRLVEDPPLPARATKAQADFLALAAQKRAAAQPSKAPAPARRRARPLWTQRWVWAVASLLLLLTFSGGVVVAAAANSVPGDALYRIKRWSESVELAFSSSDGQITQRIEFCNERRRELAQLVGTNQPVPPALVQEIATETAAIEQALDDKGPADQRWASLNTLTTDVAATLAIVPADDPALEAAVEHARVQSRTTEVRSREVL